MRRSACRYPVGHWQTCRSPTHGLLVALSMIDGAVEGNNFCCTPPALQLIYHRTFVSARRQFRNIRSGTGRRSVPCFDHSVLHACVESRCLHANPADTRSPRAPLTTPFPYQILTILFNDPYTGSVH